MRGIRHTQLVLATLLAIAGMAVTSLAQARNNWHKLFNHQQANRSLPVCIDKLYQITHCQSLATLGAHKQMIWQTPLYTMDAVPNRLYFSFNKSRCRQKNRPRPTLLRALFPRLPDLRLDLEQFVVNVEVPSELNASTIGRSSLRLGYRSCW